MILLIGGNGNTGRAIIPRLRARGARVRVLVSNEQSAASVAELGVEPVVGDFRSEDSLRHAMRGCQRVFHTVPPLLRDEYQIGLNAIAAATAEGIAHFVYMSLMLPHQEEVPFHWEKLKVQKELRQSALAYTIVQPTNFMQNIGWAWASIVETGRYVLPYSENQGVTWVDMHDFAAAAAVILTEDSHAYATYEIVGTPPLTRVELCRVLTRAIGRPVVAATISIDEFMALPQWRPFDDYERSTLREMMVDFDRHGFRCGGTRALAWLLGREPTSFETFAQRYAQAPEIMTWHNTREKAA